MTISTIDDAVLGIQPIEYFHNELSGNLVAGRPFTPFYKAGVPGPAVEPTPGISGAALTSYAGAFSFPAAVGGETIHLAGFAGGVSAQSGTLLLCDRLWHNSGNSVTSTSSQTINSVAFPARDANGSTDGEGVYIGLEVSTALGSGTPTLTLGYTNSAGTSGRTTANIQPVVASSAIGTFYQFGLQAGDVGVRSIQTYQQSATMVSGVHHLVAYRVIRVLECPNAGVVEQLTLLTGGMPRCYDNTVPFIIFIPNTTTTTSIFGTVAFTQG